jgi:DNA-binding NtrC family response regulator
MSMSLGGEDVNKVLMICDDHVLAMLYRDELTEEGYDVHVPNDPRKPISNFEEVAPDVVLVDCLPERYRRSDLWEAYSNGRCTAPIVLCTDHPPCEEELGFADYLVLKRSDLTTLKTVLKRSVTKVPGGEGLRAEANICGKEAVSPQ